MNWFHPMLDIESTPVTGMCLLEDFGALTQWIRATMPFEVDGFSAADTHVQPV
jgi:hypothetical protein